MKKTIITCDACGKEIESNQIDMSSLLNVFFEPKNISDACSVTISHNISGCEKHFDLCHPCAVKFADALEEFFKENDKEGST